MFLNYKNSEKGGADNPFKKDPEATEILKNAVEKDSDNDGLKDWEEVLWKTDRNNADTDGDGISDGEEIKINRNPAKPGPDDELDKLSAESQNEDSESDETEELTKTDILARDFFAAFLSLQQSENLNNETKEKLTRSFLANMTQEKLTDKYSLSDLNIINDNTNKTLKNYGNKTAGIINKYQPKSDSEDNEIIIIAKAMENEDKDELQKLDLIIELYKGTAKDLMLIIIPESSARYHLDLINGIINLSEALINIKKIFEDPIQGLIGINQYQNEYFRIRRALRGMGDYFADRKIIFNKNENGYIFMKK